MAGIEDDRGRENAAVWASAIGAAFGNGIVPSTHTVGAPQQAAPRRGTRLSEWLKPRRER
jgi:hypothetical protein